jgi:AcrR family transcriptional regulator
MDNTQDRLLDAAGEIFAAKGFESATVRDICRQANVNNLAAVNYYFGDKESLYIAAVQQAFAGRAVAAPRVEWPEGATAADKLRTLIGGLARSLIGGNRPPWHMQLMARELSQPSAACLAFVRDFAEPVFRSLIEVFQEFLPADVSEEQRHLMALSIIGQCVYHRCARLIITKVVGEEEVAGYTADRLAEHIADFSLAALGLARPMGERGAPVEQTR